MPKAIRYEVDLSEGHDCFPPTLPKNEGNNMWAATRINDLYEPHECPDGTKHDPEEIFALEGSSNVFANCRPMHREGDKVSCDDVGANGSPDVYINEPGGSWDIPADITINLYGTELTEGFPREEELGYQNVPQDPFECAESFAARAADASSGEQHASIPTGPVIPNKIANASIPVNCSLEVKTQFSITPGTNDEPNPENIEWFAEEIPEGLKLSLTGMLEGKLTAEGSYDIVISVTDVDTRNVLDVKPFVIQANKCSDGIKFRNPIGIMRVTSRFMEPRKNRYHKGIDMSYGPGQSGPIFAAADGVVVLKRFQAKGYGHYLCIGHRDASGKQRCVSLYAHMKSAPTVNVGDKVSSGQVIGQVGNTGHSFGNHLHFEIREANFIPSPGVFNPKSKPLDPLKYINGTFIIDQGIGENHMKNNPTIKTPFDPGGQITDKTITYTETNKIFPAEKYDIASPCESPPITAKPEPQPPVTGSAKGPYSTRDCPNCPTSLSKQQVIDIINNTMDTYPSLDALDRKFILNIARVESNYDPCAKNSKSSALGLYQFLESLAVSYGVPGCERTDPEKATKAMIAFYQKELLRYYNSYVSSGHTRIGGHTIAKNAHTARYKSLPKDIFIYGLLHHDGIGNAVKGVDKGGVAYATRTMSA